jgi:hypothetical protein
VPFCTIFHHAFVRLDLLLCASLNIVVEWHFLEQSRRLHALLATYLHQGIVVEAKLKIRCGRMNKDYVKLTNLYAITLISMKNKKIRCGSSQTLPDCWLRHRQGIMFEVNDTSPTYP